LGEADTKWELPTVPRTIRKFDRYPALKKNWSFSVDFLDYLSTKCSTGLSSNVETIALAGSFGRLEGSPESDADYIMVVKDPEHASIPTDKELLQKAIEGYGVPPPNKSGVFSQPRSQSQLIDPIGEADEKVDELGKRMLLLLESRPIYHADLFDVLVNKIFEKYANYVTGDTDKEFAFLTNDLIRYFRFICVNYQSNFWRQNEKWALRNLKLRHSRIVMYSGLLFLMGEASKYNDSTKVEIVRRHLSYTPLERLAWVYDENHDGGFFRVLGLYNVFISRLSDSGWRGQLKDVEYEGRYAVQAFSELKANSDAFIAEFVRFIFARRGQWSERFFEYLFF
jgi:hypothetical protein